MFEQEYGASLDKPNNRFSISKENCVVRVKVYLQNISKMRQYFSKTFGVDPAVANVGQILKYRN